MTRRSTPGASRTAPPSTVTPASAWRAGELLTLPSGYTVRVRPSLGIAALAAGAGHIPNPLADEVARALLADHETPGDTPDEARRLARFRDQQRGLIAVAQAYLIEPRLVLDREPDYDAGEIGPLDLHENDLWTLYNAALGGPAALRRFRDAGEPEPAR